MGLPSLRSTHRLPIGLGHLDGFAAIHEGAGHLGAELVGRGREFAPAMWTDEFQGVCRQLDVFRCRYHELFAAVGAIEDGVVELATGGETRGAVRTFETERHKRLKEHLLYRLPRDCTGEKLKLGGIALKERGTIR